MKNRYRWSLVPCYLLSNHSEGGTGQILKRPTVEHTQTRRSVLSAYVPHPEQGSTLRQGFYFGGYSVSDQPLHFQPGVFKRVPGLFKVEKETLVDTRPFKSNDDQWHWIRVYWQTDRPEGVSPTQNETKPAPLVVRALWVFLEISSTIRILLSTGVVASISCGLSFSLQFSLTPQIIWRCWWSYHLR